ncbi:unnamed protein product, partial [Polarella glacialis]
VFEAFRIYQQAYVDEHSLTEFLTGPSFSIYSAEPIGTSSGLRYYQENAQHLVEVMESTPGCGTADNSTPADIATASTLQERFGGDCPNVAAELQQISDAYGYALARIEETNKQDFNTTYDKVWMPSDVVTAISPFLNRNLHIDPAGSAMDAGKHVLSSPPGSEKWKVAKTLDEVLVIDDVFSEEAIEKIRLFTDRSTLFHAQKPGGYQGAYLTEGFSAPVLAQAFAELQAALPSILCKHRLTNAWAYKYDSYDGVENVSTKTGKANQPSDGIGVHADSAAVNINCWLVPDSSISDPEYGGMKVWPTRPPLDWDTSYYNQGDHMLIEQEDDGVFRYRQRANLNYVEMNQFIKTHEPQVIPYKKNRCVIFDSALLHATNKVRFRKGIRNRRINLTFLAGLMRDTCEAVEERSKAGRAAAVMHRK